MMKRVSILFPLFLLSASCGSDAAVDTFEPEQVALQYASLLATGTHTGGANAVHMQLKDAAGNVACAAYDTPADAPPVATECPSGTWTEQLFDANWNQISSNREVTVTESDPMPATAGTHTGGANAVHMQLKDAAGNVVCSAYNTPADAPPVATECPSGTWTEQLFDANWNQISSNREVTVTESDTMPPSDELISMVDIIEITETSARVTWNAGEPVTGQVFYGETSSYGTSTKKEESFTYTAHRQDITALKPDTLYHIQIVSETQDGRRLVSSDQTFRTAGSGDEKPPVIDGEGVLFSAIESGGLSNGCYPTTDHHVAEFLYQNPGVCFWSVDRASQRIQALPTPTVPNNAVTLPRPSGGDDTRALMAVINTNQGRAVVGNGGPYRVSNLKVTVPVDIFNLSMVPHGNATSMIVVESEDVRIFNSHIDAKDSQTVEFGFQARDGAHNFVLVKSSFRNSKNTRGKSVAGVRLNAVDDFHIACNEFENIINDSPDAGSSKPKLEWTTSRANAVWMNGGKSSSRPGGSTSGGYIVNNYAENLQSNGSRNDAEFFTIQSYESTDSQNPVRIFANRGVNAGKRLTKHQESDAIVLSNEYDWNTKGGPLGDRSLFGAVSIQFSDNIIARNNRFKVGAQSRFDYIFVNMLKSRTTPQNNIHFDCNDIEVRDELDANSGSRPYLICMRADGKSGTDGEPTNSSVRNNVARGMGSVRHHYWFGDGYSREGGRVDTSNNQFNIEFTDSKYR